MLFQIGAGILIANMEIFCTCFWFSLYEGNIRTYATCLQGKLAEVYFGFKKVEKIINIYNETHEKGDE